MIIKQQKQIYLRNTYKSNRTGDHGYYYLCGHSMALIVLVLASFMYLLKASVATEFVLPQWIQLLGHNKNFNKTKKQFKTNEDFWEFWTFEKHTICSSPTFVTIA